MQNWAVNFIISLMIIILIQYVAPEGKFDRQIKFAASVMFILAVFVPAAEMIRNASYESQYFKTALYLDTVRLDYSTEGAKQTYKTALIAEYRQNLTDSILARLKNDVNFDGAIEIEVDEDENSESFGNILSLSIISNTKTDASKIKKVLKDFYNIDENNIYINEIGEDSNEIR